MASPAHGVTSPYRRKKKTRKGTGPFVDIMNALKSFYHKGA